MEGQKRKGEVIKYFIDEAITTIDVMRYDRWIYVRERYFI